MTLAAKALALHAHTHRVDEAEKIVVSLTLFPFRLRFTKIKSNLSVNEYELTMSIGLLTSFCGSVKMNFGFGGFIPALGTSSVVSVIVF